LKNPHSFADDFRGSGTSSATVASRVDSMSQLIWKVGHIDIGSSIDMNPPTPMMWRMRRFVRHQRIRTLTLRDHFFARDWTGGYHRYTFIDDLKFIATIKIGDIRQNNGNRFRVNIPVMLGIQENVMKDKGGWQTTTITCIPHGWSPHQKSHYEWYKATYQGVTL
jgi:hypothetical protein